MSLYQEIINQLSDEKYGIVQETIDRLKTLDLDDETIFTSLNRAYDSSMEETGKLNDELYVKNLNRLPADIVPSKQQFESMVQSMAQLVSTQITSLEPIEVDYVLADLTLEDGFLSKVKILTKVTIEDIGALLAMREALDNDTLKEVVLETNEQDMMLLNEIQRHEALGEIIEIGDKLHFYFVENEEKMTLEFTSVSLQQFLPMETILTR